MQDTPTQPPIEELLTDRELARLLRVGITKVFELQRRPDFPAPLWLGPRLKRHRASRALAWALAQQERPPEPTGSDAQRRGAKGGA